jgi:hypothetical protein
MLDRNQIIEALKQGKVFKAYCAEDDFWLFWRHDWSDGDVMSCRGWGRVVNDTEFISLELAACEITGYMRSPRFRTN